MAAHRVNQIIPPRNAVGYLAMQWSSGGWAYGTGALIDDRNIVTCSHNLMDPVTDPPPRGQAVQVLFYRAYNQQRPADPPPGGLAVRVGFYSNNFLAGQDAWDVGLCRLAAPVPAQPFFTPRITGQAIIGQAVTLTGYPGIHRGEMWEDTDEVAGVHIPTNTIIYTHDTWSGNSGSPTWTYDALEDVTLLHAIHVSRQAQELRRGVLVTAAIHQWIQTARQSLTPPGPGFQLVGL
jgi:V8-like Glu-specific endopeptidase